MQVYNAVLWKTETDAGKAFQKRQSLQDRVRKLEEEKQSSKIKSIQCFQIALDVKCTVQPPLVDHMVNTSIYLFIMLRYEDTLKKDF